MTFSFGAHWNAALAGLQVKPDEMSSDYWQTTLKNRMEVAGAVDQLLEKGPSEVPANIEWKAAITEVGTRPEGISDEDWLTFVKVRLSQVVMPKVENKPEEDVDTSEDEEGESESEEDGGEDNVMSQEQLMAYLSKLDFQHCNKCNKAHFMATKVKVNNVELEVYVSPTSIGSYLCREDYEKIGEPKLVEKNIVVSGIGMMDMAEGLFDCSLQWGKKPQMKFVQGIAFLNASVSCMGGDWIEALGLNVNKTTCPCSIKCCPVDFLTLYAPDKKTSEKFEKKWLAKKSNSTK